jgi:hypothetical protein
MPTIRRDFQRAQLLADGRKLVAAIQQGASPGALELTFNGSRARMYRALNAAIAADGIEVRQGRNKPPVRRRKTVDELLL